MNHNLLCQILEISWLIIESTLMVLNFCHLPGSLWHQEQGLAWPLEEKSVVNYELIESFLPSEPNMSLSGWLGSVDEQLRWAVDGWFNRPLATNRRRHLCHLLNKQPLLWPKAKNKLKRKKFNYACGTKLCFGEGDLKKLVVHGTKE